MMRATRRVLAGCLALVAVVVGGAATGGAVAQAGCERIIFVNPQLTVHERAGRVVFTVFSGGCAAAGWVRYASSPGTATPGTDYTPVSGSLYWTAGDFTTRRIIVPVAGDTVAEPEIEDFRLSLSQPAANIKIGHGSGHARVLDGNNTIAVGVADDQLCPVIPVFGSSPSGQPWLTGEQRALCDVHEGVIDIAVCELSGSNTITYGTAEGTAQPGVDYVAVTAGTVQVPPATSLAQLPFQLVRGTPATPSRWFRVVVTDTDPGCPFADRSATVMIGSPAAG